MLRAGQGRWDFASPSPGRRRKASIVAKADGAAEDRVLWLIKPNSTFHLLWMLLQSACIVFELFLVPMSVSILDEQPRWTTVAEGIIDALFLLDSVVKARLEYIDPRSSRVVWSRRRMNRRYLRDWAVLDTLSQVDLWLCLLAFVPWAVGVLLQRACGHWDLEGGPCAAGNVAWYLSWAPRELATATSWLRWTRLLRLAHLLHYVSFVESQMLFRAMHPRAVRLGCLALQIFALMHLTGLSWFALARHEGFPKGNAFMPSAKLRGAPIGEKYFHAVYYGLLVCTGQTFPRIDGVEITPETLLEKSFIGIVSLIALVTYATLVGNLASLITEAATRISDFRQKLEDLLWYLDAKEVPPPLKRRIQRFYEFAYTTQMSPAIEAHVCKELPNYLSKELLVFVNGALLQKVKIFNRCSSGFRNAVCTIAQPEVCLPGDLLIRQGDFGDSAYILRSGLVYVFQVDDDGEEDVKAELGEGAIIGEMALLRNEKRTANVRAVFFTQLFMITRQDFLELAENFPEDVKELKELSESRMQGLSTESTAAGAFFGKPPESEHPHSADKGGSKRPRGGLSLGEDARVYDLRTQNGGHSPSFAYSPGTDGGWWSIRNSFRVDPNGTPWHRPGPRPANAGVARAGAGAGAGDGATLGLLPLKARKRLGRIPGTP